MKGILGRVVAAMLLGGVVVVGGLFVWRGRTAPAPSQRPSPPQISVGLREGSIVLRQKGVKQAEVRARRVVVSADLRSARFVDITQAILFDQGAEALRVSAAEIRMNRETNDLQILGPVVVTSPTGYRLTAPEAAWHHAQQQVVFPHGVHVRYGTQQLQAGRLVVDAGLKAFDLSGGVDIVFQIEGMRP